MEPEQMTTPRRRGPKLPPVALTGEERTTLERWARRRSSSQALAERCRIVLACAEAASNQAVAERLGVSRPTVTKWRSRFVTRRLEGLADEPVRARPGRSPMSRSSGSSSRPLSRPPRMRPIGRPGRWPARWA